MLTYCLVCKKNKENKDVKMIKDKTGRLIMSSKCSVCGNKTPRFMKEQETKRLLSNLGIKTTLIKIPLLNVLF